MQTSMRYVLTPARTQRLAALGWKIDPAFGNFAQTFPARMPLGEVADRILVTLAEGYDADVAHLEVESNWIASEPCPPRNGPNQNLAGLINDAPSMAATAVHDCAYDAEDNPAIPSSPLSTSDLFGLYGGRVTGEVQRLRINLDRRIWMILDTDLGYVQCQPQTEPAAIYCEAESADSWPALASVLTPDRITRLHAAGFADPGRAPNYSKTYLLAQADDAAIAKELLAILHDVYGYGGAPKLGVKTEKDPD
jgi:hypothetical protein